MGEAQREWRGGWRTVLAASLGNATGLALYPYLTSFFIKPLAMEFGWTREEISRAGVATILAATCAPLVGRLADYLGVRPVIALSALAYAGACAGMASLNGDIGMYYVMQFLLVSTGFATSGLLWARPIGVAFDRTLGVALAVSFSAIAISAALMPFALTAVITAFDWRAGWLTLGFTALGAAMIALMILPGRHAGKGGAKTQEAGLPLSQAVRHPAFWAVVIGMFVINIPSGGIMNQMAALISDKGFKGPDIAAAASGFAIAVIIGRLIAGFCLDRFPAGWVAFVTMAAPAAGCVILAFPAIGFGMTVGALVLAGLSQGAEGDVGPYVVRRAFGLKAFVTIYGFVSFAVTAGTGVGAMIFGAIHTRTGDYQLALWIGAVCFLVGACIFLGIGIRPPVHEGGDQTADQIGMRKIS